MRKGEGAEENLNSSPPSSHKPSGPSVNKGASPLRKPAPHPSRTLCSSSAIRKPGCRHSKCVPKAAFPEIANAAPVVKTRLPCRRHERHGFDPWVGKTPWRRAWQPTPVFLPGESMDRGAWRATVHGVSKCWTQLKQLSMHTESVDLVIVCECTE